MGRIKFTTDQTEVALIHRIARRAYKQLQGLDQSLSLLDLAMEISSVHANGCPLDLRRFLNANDVTFANDFFGIRKHLDRKTGRLIGFHPSIALRNAA